MCSAAANVTAWGSYLLVGTFDGTAVTLTEPAVVDDGLAAGSALRYRAGAR